MAVMTITFDGDYSLDFDLEATPIVDLWLEKMHQRHDWLLDDPRRFYGFDDPIVAKQEAESRLLDCINTINSYQKIITKPWTSIDDQDQLNYLHNIFERYHGLLDQQDTDWWQSCPDSVRRALANLNILVHRAESACRGNNPRVVCTWFGMPKDSHLPREYQEQYGRLAYEFGGVYLNYVEIGKTLEDLSIDDDHWIGDDAFQPFSRYSADFNIQFFDQAVDLDRIRSYFDQHRDFFASRGIESIRDYRAMPRRYKVAQLRLNSPRDSVLHALQSRQNITEINLA